MLATLIGETISVIVGMCSALSAATLLAALVAAIATHGVRAQPDTERLIAFASDRDGNYEIYLMREDGSGQTRLTFNAADDVTPTWLDDGTLAFASNRDGVWRLYTMRADGSEQAPMADSGAAAFDPTASPDGQSVAFESREGGEATIYGMGREGGGRRRLASGGAAANPAWSPNGDLIAFERANAAGNQLYVVDPGGGEPRQLTSGRATATHPAWSNGQEVVYERQTKNSTDLYRVSVDGTGQSGVVIARRGFETMPAYSPEGELLFVAFRGEGDAEIFSGDGRNLSNSRRGDDIEPQWAPALPLPPLQQALNPGALFASSPSCTWVGNNRANTKFGGPGRNVLCGFGGRDTLFGLGDDDTLSGGRGRDRRLDGGRGNDALGGWEDPPRRDCVYGGRGQGDHGLLDRRLDNRSPCRGPFGIEAVH